MKSRIPFSFTLMLVALVLSFVPAASIGTQSAAALPPAIGRSLSQT